jgi:hypothetical protein
MKLYKLWQWLKKHHEVLLLLVSFIFWLFQILVLFRQTDILEKQTELLVRQSSIQENQFKFDQEKNWIDTAKEYREIMNNLYDKVNWVNSDILRSVHLKILNWEKVPDIKNLDMYVNEFENIWSLFCDWKIKKEDLDFIFKRTIQPICWNYQICNHYQNTKSWLSWICETLFSWSSCMGKYKDSNKCVILKNKNN